MSIPTRVPEVDFQEGTLALALQTISRDIVSLVNHVQFLITLNVIFHT